MTDLEAIAWALFALLALLGLIDLFRKEFRLSTKPRGGEQNE